MSFPSNVILHAFDWPYALITERAKELAELGYKSVLVSPSYVSQKSKTRTPWWQRYQPQDYRVIDNELGNTQSFKTMVETLQNYGIAVYADIVFNHMANEFGRENHLDFPGAEVLKRYAKDRNYYDQQCLFGDISENLFTNADFVDFGPIVNWEDRDEVQLGRISSGDGDYGLPPLAHNAHVIGAQQAYLRALKEIGVKGFRIDAAKHMSIPHIKAVFTKDLTQDMHVFGEIITDGGVDKNEYQIFLEPYLKETQLGAYDFPRFQSIWETLTENLPLTNLIDPYSIGQALEGRRAITFAVTHDIPNNEVFLEKVLTEVDESHAYAYIMSLADGVPLIYSDLNSSNILNSKNQPRWQDAYKDPLIKAMIQFYHHCFSAKIKITATKDTLVIARENKGIVLINRSKSEQKILIPSIEGHYINLFTQELLDAEKSITLPPNAVLPLIVQ